MTISDRDARLVRNIGIALMIPGGVLVAWALGRFDQLPNYQRMLVLVPWMTGLPMFFIEHYRSGWTSLSTIAKGHAIAAPFMPPLLVVAAVAWYLIDPAAKT